MIFFWWVTNQVCVLYCASNLEADFYEQAASTTSMTAGVHWILPGVMEIAHCCEILLQGRDYILFYSLAEQTRALMEQSPEIEGDLTLNPNRFFVCENPHGQCHETNLVCLCRN